MNKSANSQPQITGNNTDELKRSLDSAMRQIWSELNKINDKVNNMNKGSQSIESSKDACAWYRIKTTIIWKLVLTMDGRGLTALSN